MSRKIKVCFVLMDYSPAAMYNLNVAKRVYDKIYAITIYGKRDDIDVEQIQFNPVLGGNIYEQLGEFIKTVVNTLEIYDEYIVLLPFNVEQRDSFNTANRILSNLGVKNEAPSKDMTDNSMIEYVIKRD